MNAKTNAKKGMNGGVAGLLAGSRPPAIYRLQTRSAVPAIAARAKSAGLRCFPLDGQGIATKAALLAACAAAMGFPRTFGGNWDALADSMRDLSWAPAECGYLVLYDHVDRLAVTQPQDLAVALEIFRDAVDYWRGTTTPMTVLLRGAGRSLPGIPWL